MAKQEAAPKTVLPSYGIRPGSAPPKSVKKTTAETASVSANAQLVRAKQRKRGHQEEPGAGKHSPAWDRCVQDVKKKGSADNAYAVCTSTVGQNGDPAKNYDQPGVITKPVKRPGDQGFSGGKSPQKIPKGPRATGSKQSARKHGNFQFLGLFKEAMAGGEGAVGKRFRVTLLSEGLGNFHDAFYYTADAIASAVPLFEGRQFFIDHPDSIEEQTRPERSVRDLAGYFENVAAEMQEDGFTQLNGDLVILPDESLSLYRTQMLESIQYAEKHPGQDLVGLSINAGGDFDTMPIQTFIESGQIPEACKEKLLEAMNRGVEVIRPVREMQSAVSCDLVTVAGAGGTINQLLEGGKYVMKHEAHQEEAHQEEAHQEEADMHQEHEEEDGADGGDAGSDGDHADAEQDKELIAQMLKKYLGDGFSDDDHQMMAQHLQNAHEMGLEGHEAEEVAGHSMKMAKHLQAKQGGMHQEEGADGAAVDVHGSPSVPAAGAKNQMKPQDQKQESHKEAARREKNGMVELTAKVARLEAELSRRNLTEHMEAKLRESKLPMAATKKFRECIKGIRSIKEFDEKLNLFKEAYSVGGKASGETGFIYGVERSGAFTESAGLGEGFGDCVEE